MKRNTMIAVWSLVCGPLMAFQVSAHHGTRASYDLDTRITLKGTVTEWRMVNPHCGLLILTSRERTARLSIGAGR